MDKSTVWRKRIGVVVSLALLVTVGTTFLTGFVAAALDLNRFAYHKYAAYLAIGLAALHVVLHRRALVGQVRRWLIGAPAPLPSAVRSPGALGPRLPRRALLLPGVALAAAGAGLGRWSVAATAPPELAPGQDLGQLYHQWSMTSYAGALAKSIHVRPQPASAYKEYPGAPTVPLPPPPPSDGRPLFDTVARRRSVREYAARPVALAELSALLHFSTGITDRRDPNWLFRAVPSSGALFPIEVYPVVLGVAGLAPGVYHYAVREHALELLRPGDFRRELFQAAVSQEMVLRTGVVLVLTGLFERLHFKYVDRSYRYMLLEAGHLGQNVYLVATALGLAPCGIGAYLDDQVNALLGVDGRDEAVLYLLAVGAA